MQLHSQVRIDVNNDHCETRTSAILQIVSAVIFALSPAICVLIKM